MAAGMEITTGQSVPVEKALMTLVIVNDTATPNAKPITPPIRESTTDSIRNCFKISLDSAPTAMRMPISRVLSVTDTSMVFMIPTPPTTSEMPAIDASMRVIVPVIMPKTLAISVVF